MQMKASIFAAAMTAAVVLVGCSSGSDMSSKDVDALKNPGKSGPPPQAANMADLTKKQQEMTSAAGVDSRGVPLANSTEKGAAPTPK